ncbi:hypothetical protein ACFO3I_02950 [Rheinheimera marina]|uniref:GTP-binding protein n=1 Tax=Rheinheimera marina TaxID=1774958 RepID=A0ABV9JIQ1_9GAMM
MKFTLLAAALFVVTPWSALGMAAPNLKPVAETANLRVPESALVWQHGAETRLLVSEIDGAGTAMDGVGGVALLGSDGAMIKQDWLRGLNAPKGMAIRGNSLFVADLTELVEVDLTTAAIIQRYPAKDSVFLNDVTVDAAGLVYVSDTRTNRIYRLQHGKLALWQQDISSANGLKATAQGLVVGSGQQLLLLQQDGKRTLLAEGFAANIDGVEPLQEGGFLISCWVGFVYHLSADGVLTLLLDSKQQFNTADIGYDAATSLLYVPTFNANSLKIYRLSH